MYKLPTKEGFKFENYVCWIINNPTKYVKNLARLLVENMDKANTLEDILLQHYISLTNLNIDDGYIQNLKMHLDNIPKNFEGIDIRFSEYIIKRVIDEVE